MKIEIEKARQEMIEETVKLNQHLGKLARPFAEELADEIERWVNEDIRRSFYGEERREEAVGIFSAPNKQKKHNVK